MSTIGSPGGQVARIFTAFGLPVFRAILRPDDFAAVAAATDCSPIRVRLLTPENVFWLMCAVAVQTTSMTQGLSLGWGWFLLAGFKLTPKRVTEEAFCLAREKLSLRFWRGLWRVLAARYEERFSSAMRWKGLRLLAVDGSEVDVPNVPALVKFFTRPRTKKGESKAPQGRLVALCSVLTGYCVDFEFISRLFSEHTALRHLIRRLRANDLLLMDRGFFSRCRHPSHSADERPLSDARPTLDPKIRAHHEDLSLRRLSDRVSHVAQDPPGDARAPQGVDLPPDLLSDRRGRPVLPFNLAA